ncbi:MAG: DUF192 domain-containing protein [Candidatus Pacearchaeota archaeon]|jgi:hypothetical protein
MKKGDILFKILVVILIISLIILFVEVIYLIDKEFSKPYLILPNDNKIYLDIADTPSKRSIGLMYREKLDENMGMLFIFEKDMNHTFWMKNTLIPLDMIFIDSNKQIVDIISNATPCKSDPCKTYSSKYPNKYVLEINVMQSEYNNLKIGDKVIFKNV